jgi:separase
LFSPCVVGNLWDVTDRDIDRLTEDFLESWLEGDDYTLEIKGSSKSDSTKNKSLLNSSLCTHLMKARRACRLSFLNGSAPIVYGLPVNFK